MVQRIPRDRTAEFRTTRLVGQPCIASCWVTIVELDEHLRHLLLGKYDGPRYISSRSLTLGRSASTSPFPMMLRFRAGLLALAFALGACGQFVSQADAKFGDQHFK